MTWLNFNLKPRRPLVFEPPMPWQARLSSEVKTHLPEKMPLSHLTKGTRFPHFLSTGDQNPRWGIQNMGAWRVNVSTGCKSFINWAVPNSLFPQNGWNTQ